jgi:predicted metal-dependent HD superfamily phosphohydrolase
MEQFAEPGTISISETTFRLIEPYFEVRPRGTAPMKSSLLINRYELLRIKPDLSLGGEGLIPNDLFYEISQLHLYSPIKYYSVETEVLRMLEEQLPQNLYYHSVKHTREVIQVVEHLALCEGVRDEGLFLLKTAALFHDLGFTQQYEHNESIGVELAQKILPDFGYSDLHIQTVSELIFATEVPHKPVNKLQEILCDADLGYLGTDDFEIISQKLKQELIEKGKIHSDKQWDEMQVPFLENHRYFTPTAIASLAPKKEENLAAVKNRLAANNYI